MFKWLSRKLTKNYKEVPLFYVTFDLPHYKKLGEKGSCIITYHPNLQNDKYVEETLKSLVDHIRDTYDMEALSK